MKTNIFEQLKQLDLSHLDQSKADNIKSKIDKALEFENDPQITDEEIQKIESFYGQIQQHLKEKNAPPQPAHADTDKKNTRIEKINVVETDIELPHKTIQMNLGITDEMLWDKENGFSPSMISLYDLLGGRYLKRKQQNKPLENIKKGVKKASQKIADWLDNLSEEQLQDMKSSDINISQSPNMNDDVPIQQDVTNQSQQQDDFNESHQQQNETTEGGAFQNEALKSIFSV